MYEPLRIAAAVEGPTDAIVLRAIPKALLPDDTECRPNPEGQFAALPKRKRTFKKRPEHYQRVRNALTKAWPSISTRLTEAGRFEAEFRTAAGVGSGQG